MRIFHHTNFNFIKWRWHAVIASVLVIGAGLATIVSRGGLPLGVDFTGGTVVVLEFKAAVDEQAVRNALGPLGNDAVVQRFGSDAGRNEIMIRLPLKGDQAQDLNEGATRVEAALRAAN